MIAESVTNQRDWFLSLCEQPLLLSLVESDESRARQIHEVLNQVANENSIDGIVLNIDPVVNQVAPDAITEQTAVDIDPNVPVNLLRITRNSINHANNESVSSQSGTEIFKYSGLSDIAAITVREVEVNSYFVRELPDRMIASRSAQDREDIGEFFGKLLNPR